MNNSERKIRKKTYTGQNGKFKRGNPGKPRGAKDKFTNLKEEFLAAFYDKDGIGGAEGIKELMRNNKRNKMIFLQMIAKMLPSNLDVEHSGQIDSKLTIEVVETK